MAILSLLALVVIRAHPGAVRPLPGAANMGTARIVASYGNLPLSFEVNRGQADNSVKFLSRGLGYNLLLKSTEAVLLLSSAPQPDIAPAPPIHMRLVGSNTQARIGGLDELPGKSNYFIGNDSKKWRTNVPTFAKVKYADVYPGIDLIYYGNQRQLEYDFSVAPGADPGAIRMHLEGADEIALNDQGDVAIRVGSKTFELRKPLVYQEAGGMRSLVGAGWVTEANGGLAFKIGVYNRTRSLVIDPVVVVYSTLVPSAPIIAAVAADPAGNAYIAGNGGVMKINPTGSAVIYSAALGGNSVFTVGENGSGIAVDAGGNAYVTGFTTSPTFPTTAGAFQRTRNGSSDAFVAKLNSDGTLIYSTLLGGSATDVARGIAVDQSGNALIAGSTTSADFPTVPSPPIYAGGTDAFVAKLDSTGSNLIYSRLLGGTQNDTANGIAVDLAGNAYVVGTTSSSGFPTVFPLQPSLPLRASQNAFVAKFDATGNFIYSTFLGGSVAETGDAIAADPGGNAYVAGNTQSPGFISSSSAASGFVVKLNPNGSSTVYASRLSDSGLLRAYAIAVDTAGNAYVAGLTSLVTGISVSFNYDDAFVTKLDSTGSSLVWTCFFGTSRSENANGIALDGAGGIYVGGLAGAFRGGQPRPPSIFPTTPGTLGAGQEGSFLIKLQEQPSVGIPNIASVTVSGLSVGQSATLTIDGTNFVLDSVVRINGTPHAFDYLSSIRLRVQLSGVEASGTASVTVFTPPPGGGLSNTATATLSAPIPPTLASITPTFAVAGSLDTILSVSGTNFLSISVVQWNGANLATTYVSASRLTAVIPASNLVTVGSFSIRVSNPPDGGTSNPLAFNVVAGTPVCSFSLAPASRSYLATAGTGGFEVFAADGCGWLAASNSDWIVLTSASGSGHGAVFYSFAANTSANARTGTITVAGQTFTFSQAGATPPSTTTSFQPSLTRSLDPGFYIVEATLAPGAIGGAWGVEVLTSSGQSAGGFNLGGGLPAGSTVAGFGAFLLTTQQTVTATLNAQTAPGTQLTMRFLDSNRQLVGSPVSGPSPLTLQSILAPGFYIVEVYNSAAVPFNFQLGLAADAFSGGMDTGGYLGEGNVGFGAFYVPVAQSVTVHLFGRATYGAVGAGDLILTLRDSNRNVIQVVSP